MKNKLTALVLALFLMASEILQAQQKAPSNGPPNHDTSAGTGAPKASGQNPAPPKVQPQSSARRRSYDRETSRIHRSGITKKELAFMAAIAGTSMGIGALAGGAKGLAIGSIVGGWGAYAGHRIWKWVK